MYIPERWGGGQEEREEEEEQKMVEMWDKRPEEAGLGWGVGRYTDFFGIYWAFRDK